jgi:sarcosine oxidase subunit beta
MSIDSKIIIIGAGAEGLSTALCLAERGATDVTVIDRAHVAAGSSCLSAGIYTRQYVSPSDIELRVEAYERLCQLERDTGLVLFRNGFVRLAHDSETMDTFERAAATQRSLGVDDALALDNSGLRSLIPDMFCDDLAGGLYSPSDGYLDGQQLCMTYAESAQRRGVRILSRHRLTGYTPLPGDRHQLHTSRGRLECDVVINAAGAWSPEVGRIFDAPIDLVPQRHQACIVEIKEPLDYILPSLMDYVPGTGTKGVYLRPEGDRQLIVGLHSNDVVDGAVDPDSFSPTVDEDFVEELIPAFLQRMPGLNDVSLVDGWAGIYPNSADDLFIVGPCPDRPGVFAVTGFGGVGVYMSPVAGRIAADWVLDGGTRPGDDAFSPYRFTADAAFAGDRVTQ